MATNATTKANKKNGVDEVTAKYYLYPDGNSFWGMNTRINGDFGVEINSPVLEKTIEVETAQEVETTNEKGEKVKTEEKVKKSETVGLSMDERKALYVDLKAKKDAEDKKKAEKD